MYRTSPLDLKNISKDFDKLMKNTGFLPSYTPVFLFDTKGRVIKHKGNLSCYAPFPSVSFMMCADEYRKFRSLTKKHDVAVASVSDTDCSFIVSSKERHGVFSGVISSCAENNCREMCDYLKKLCSYRDYLCSFEDAAFTDDGARNASDILLTRISGAYALEDLCFPVTSDSSSVYICLNTFISRLCALVEALDGNEKGISIVPHVYDAYTAINDRITKTLVACASFMMNESVSGNISVAFNTKPEKAYVSFTAKTFSETRSSLFENTIMKALEKSHLDFSFSRKEAETVLTVGFITIPKETVSVKDAAEMTDLSDKILSNRLFSDIFYTITQKKTALR